MTSFEFYYYDWYYCQAPDPVPGQYEDFYSDFQRKERGLTLKSDRLT